MADLGFEGGENGALGGIEEGLQGMDLLHVALPGTRGMAFHQVHRLGPIGCPLERGADGDLLGNTGGLHHTQMVVARSHARDDGVDQCPSRTGRTFPLNDDYPPAFAQDHPVTFGIEGA